MRGHIDLVTPEGRVEGWCWNEQVPADRIGVAILVDGEEAGRILACEFREDLRAAGIGDGYHFFRLLLPDLALAQRRSHTVTLADAVTGTLIGQPYTVRFRRGVRFDNRLRELETRNRLLATRLEEIAGSSPRANAPAELFSVVGAFFQRLADDFAHGVPLTPERHLREALQTITKTHPPVKFPISNDPTVSVLLEAACPLNHLYECLKSLQRASVRTDIRVTVLDCGSYDELALVPSIARGIRYLKVGAGLVSEWTQAEHGESSPILLFLSGQGTISETFFQQLVETLDADPHVAAVGGYVVDSSGSVREAGLRLLGSELLDCAVAGYPELGIDPATAFPVHALGHRAIGFRRSAFDAVGGLDPVFGDDLGAAVVDLCFRLRAAGWSVICEPRAAVLIPRVIEQSCAADSPSVRALGRELLQQRWFSKPVADDRPLFAGSAALFGVPGEDEA